MRVKEYLRQVQKLDIMIRQRQQQLDELRATVLSATDPSREHVQGGALPGDEKIVAHFARVTELEHEVTALVGQYTDLKHRIIGEIQSLPDVRFMDILFRRYIQYQSLEEIACGIHYSYRQICRLHGAALLEFERWHTMSHFPVVC